uniref:Integrase catalytic domain-containing protein n=1 Tax=Tanacetum cinerariifolium TaxID=118510 RepID=A0A6L2MW22_TANCI|nr:hypothetical protein [Tanacetum cinerariifolium]
MLRDNALVELRNKFEKVEQERDELKLKLDKFQTSSKNLSQLLASQTFDKTSLGYDNQVFNSTVFDCDEMFSSKSDVSMPASPVYDRYKSREGYHDVPPPYIGTFMPPKPDLVFHDAPTINETVLTIEPSTAKPNKDLLSVKPVEHPILAENLRKHIPMSRGHRHSWNRKACFVCKSLTHLIKNYDYYEKKMVQQPGNPHHALKDKRVIDSGCSRRMIGNISYLSEFEEINGGYVSFGGIQKVVKLQMCDKKNIILFTNTECIVLSFDFKLPDDNHVLLRVPRENNMYNVDLKNIVPLGDLTCLFAKATLDESNLYHRRLGHINFKTMNKLVKVVTDDYSRFSCVFFLATKDETSTILKTFITGIENQLNLKVKIIRSDNGTEFKNQDLNQFCGIKVIKREFSVPRNPQQNGIIERKNRTLIEAASTMLADSLLPIPFWAEAVNTACYVQNRVLMTKPHNKTPYELLLGKFDGKADEGFLVGYSVSSKAFRVFNSRTKIVQETLHINFLENQPNIAGSGPTWLFDIDTPTQSMNYQPVIVGNQSNSGAGIQEHFDVEKAGEGNAQQYVLFPLWYTGSKDHQNTNNDATFKVKEPEYAVHVSLSSCDKTKKHDDKTKREAKGKSHVKLSIRVRNLSEEFEGFSSDSTNGDTPASTLVTTVRQNSTNITNTFSAAGPSNTVVSPTLRKSSYVDPSQYPDDPDIPALEDITYFDDEEDVDHPVTQIIGDLSFAPQTRSMTRMVKEDGGLTQINNDDFNTCMFACFLSQEEPKRVHQALKDPSWIKAMQEELLQFKMQKEEGIYYKEAFALVARIEAIRLFLAYASFMGFMVYQIDVKSAFLYGTIEEEVYVCQHPGFKDHNYLDKVYKVVKALHGLHQALRAWYETLANYLLENGFQMGKIDQTLFIKMQKGDILLVQVYVDDIIFGSTNKDLCKDFEKLIKDKFQMSSMGELTFFLRLQIKQKQDRIFISQDKYVAKILRKFGLTDGKSASTPIDIEKPLLKDPHREDVNVHTYRSMIGSLMYLTSLRPDIMNLKGKPHLGLRYPKDLPFNLVAYSDSDYAGASLDRNSTIGGCQFLGCRLISWQCKKQTVVATSSTDAEYVAATSYCAQTNDVVRLQALIDRRKVIIIEDTVRQALRLDDVDSIDCLPNEEIFAQLARIGYKKPSTNSYMPLAVIWLATGGIAKLDADEDVTLEEIAVEVAKDADDDEAKPTKLIEVIKVVSTAELMTEVVTADAATTDAPIITATLMPAASAARRRNGVLVEEPKPLKKQAHIEQDEACARELEAELNANINWNEVIEQVKRKEKQDNTVTRYQALKRKPQTEAQTRKNMMVYLKNMTRFKMDFFKEELEEEASKQSKKENETSKEKAAKNQKLDEEVNELKTHLQIIPNDEDDVYTDATPLALKVPVIDYQVHTEHNKPYYKIIRADGTHQIFLSFISLLRNFDREDLEMLWKIIQERFASSKPKNFLDDFLLNTLKTMFENPDVEASIWKSKSGKYGLAKVKSWKLLESCGVHIITFITTQMILLVERRYPLTRFTLDQMFNNVRLEVEEESEVSLELL